MPAPDSESRVSQKHLDAMLYLLDDPALDRSRFEARLENDQELAEILACSVASYQSLQSISAWEVIPPLETARSKSMQSESMQPASRNWSWSMFGALAATVLVLIVAAWQVLFTSQPGFTKRWTDTLVQGRDLPSNTVLAWSEMREDVSEREMDNEFSLAMTDSTNDPEIPEWIVLAASDSLYAGSDSVDGKGMIQ